MEGRFWAHRECTLLTARGLLALPGH
uniref:Uncharacterized protein n=1 Tax=Anguilla anguilla TaxID=7936 RepID=A0A0E9Q6G8_ANGAN